MKKLTDEQWGFVAMAAYLVLIEAFLILVLGGGVIVAKLVHAFIRAVSGG